MRELHTSLTIGEREMRSCSDQFKYTTAGFSPRIMSSAVKSEPEKHLTTLSESRSSIFVVRVLQQSTKNTASLQRSGRVADSTVGGRGCEHGLLDQAGEAVADALGGAPVEAEDVLVQVPLQVLRADGAVMGAEQPALGEGEHEVDRRQPERRVTPGPGEVDRLVAVALGGEAVVAAPAVGRDLGRAADVAAEEALEARGRGVGHRLQAPPAEPPSLAAPALARAGDYRVAGRPAPGLAGLGTADQGLVGLHAPAERLAISRHHGAADLCSQAQAVP